MNLTFDLQQFYLDNFGIKTNFSNLEIPDKQDGLNCPIIVAKNMMPQMVFEKCAEFFQARKDTDDSLDKVVS